MSTPPNWRSYGGIGHYEKSPSLNVNYLTADYFTLKNDYVGYFTVSGEYHVTKDSTLDGNLVVGGNTVLNVTGGNTIVHGESFLLQNVNIYGDNHVYGNLLLEHSLDIVGDVDIGGNLTIENNRIQLGKRGAGGSDTYVSMIADPTTASMGLNMHLNSASAVPLATMDILSNRDNALNVKTYSSKNINILAQNATQQGLALYTDASRTIVGMYNEPGHSVPQVPTPSMGTMDMSMTYTVGGDFDVGSGAAGMSGNINLHSRLSVSNHHATGGSSSATSGKHTIYGETVVVYDTSAGAFLYPAYEVDAGVYTTGHALTLVADNSMSNTCMHLVTGGATTTLRDGAVARPDGTVAQSDEPVWTGVEGLSIGGGSYVSDASRSMGMVGVRGWAWSGVGSADAVTEGGGGVETGGQWVPTQTMVTGNSCVKHRSTLGINTYAPKTERYGLNINGPVLIEDSEVTLVRDASNQLTGTISCRAATNLAVAFGTPSIYPSVAGTFALGNVYASRDGGQSWKNSILHTHEYEVPLAIRGGVVYDASVSLLCGENGVALYSFAGYHTDYYPLTLSVEGGSLNVMRTMRLTSGNNVMVIMVSYVSNVYVLNYFVLSSIDALALFQDPVSHEFTVPSSVDVSYCCAIKTHSLVGAGNIQKVYAMDGYDASYVLLAGTGIQKWNLVPGLHMDASGHLVNAGGGAVTDAFVRVENVHNATRTYQALQTYRVYDPLSGALVGGDPLFSVCVGKGGIITWTYDAGLTWHDTVLGGGSIDWNDVCIRDRQNVVIVGTSGSFACTKDGGLTWTLVSPAVLNANGAGGLVTDPSYSLSSVVMPTVDGIVVSKLYTPWKKDDGSGSVVPPTNGHSKLFYCYLPDLFSHIGHSVLDICGSMHVSGDAFVYDNITVSQQTYLGANVTIATDVSAGGNVYCGNHTFLNYIDDYAGNLMIGTIGGGKHIQISGGSAAVGIPNTITIGSGVDELTLQGNLQLAGQVSTTTKSIQLLKGSIGSTDSAGAGIYVRNNGNDRAGYLAVNQALDGWLVKPTVSSATVVNLATQTMNLDLPNVRDITTGERMHRALVWMQDSGVGELDSSYSMVMGTIDASNLFLQHHLDPASSATNQVVATNVEISGNRLAVRGTVDSIGGLSVTGSMPSGTLQVGGGGWMGGNLWLGGNVVVNSTRECISNTGGDGALAVGGGGSFGGNVFVGGNTVIVGTLEVKKDVGLQANIYVCGDLELDSS